jgi:hypothetical protein
MLTYTGLARIHVTLEIRYRANLQRRPDAPSPRISRLSSLAPTSRRQPQPLLSGIGTMVSYRSERKMKRKDPYQVCRFSTQNKKKYHNHSLPPNPTRDNTCRIPTKVPQHLTRDKGGTPERRQVNPSNTTLLVVPVPPRQKSKCKVRGLLDDPAKEEGGDRGGYKQSIKENESAKAHPVGVFCSRNVSCFVLLSGTDPFLLLSGIC